MAKQPKKRAERLRKEQEAMNHVLNIFLIGILAESYLLIMHKRLLGTASQMLGAVAALKWIGIIGAVLAVAGLVLMLVKKDKPKLRLGGLWMLIAGAFLALGNGLMYVLYPRGSQILCAAVPIVAVLGLVYYLFQREFFLSAVVLGGTMFSLWVLGRGLGTVNWNTKVIAGAVVVLIGLAAVALLTRKVEKNAGKWGGKKEIVVFTPACSYKALYLVYAVAAVVIVLALLAASTVYYTMWVTGILLFALAVYYATKLM